MREFADCQAEFPLPGHAKNRRIGIVHSKGSNTLGDQTCESLACEGETMTTAAIATYAYDKIDQARAELNAVSK